MTRKSSVITVEMPIWRSTPVSVISREQRLAVKEKSLLESLYGEGKHAVNEIHQLLLDST